jgi:hypothetical protein
MGTDKSIVISNFPTKIGNLSTISSDTPEKKEFNFRFLGFVSAIEYQKFLENTLEKLFSSLMLYQTVYINDKDFLKVMSFLGVVDSIALLETNKIKLTHTYQEPHVIAHYSKTKLSNKIYYEIEPIQYIPALIYVEKNYSVFSDNLFLKEKLLKYLENAYVDINDFDEKLYPSAMEKLLKLENYNLKNMKYSETFQLFRQYEIAQSFNLQNKYHIHDNLLDAYSNNYLKEKSPYYEGKFEKFELFEDITRQKKIPNLFRMYKEGTLKIKDFIEICDNANTKKFSDWLFDPTVTENTILYELTKAPIVNLRSKNLRFTLVSLISLNCHPLFSLLASAIESYLPQQQIGWHPTLFLDHVLDKRLSLMQKKHLNQQERLEIYKKFKTIDGNSICPCLKSRKKYKNCCGASRVL